MELTMNELDLLKQELFGNPDNAISDIKFYPGASREHSIEEIASSIRAAITSVRNGGGQPIDLSI
jgi:hypothetical protein